MDKKTQYLIYMTGLMCTLWPERQTSATIIISGRSQRKQIKKTNPYGEKKVGPSRPIFFNFKGYYIPYMWR